MGAEFVPAFALPVQWQYLLHAVSEQRQTNALDDVDVQTAVLEIREGIP
jgi:hypothetical protein